ncbi:MAG: ArnT family glycosyltransferase [Phycisphaeraceae bacterium]
MHSLEAIPEPTNNAPKEPTDVAQHVPLALAIEEPLSRPGTEAAAEKPTADNDHQVDNLAILLVLLIAGALLRIVLGLLGPLQGIDPTRAEQAQQSGRDILAGDSINAYPLIDLLALGVGSVGLPAWAIVVLGSLLTLAAIPAAYVIGHVLTGRPLAGIVAAAILAVHPAVLTASNSYTASAIALGLITVGLALLCNIEKRGGAAASIGGILLGLAAFASPMCWLVGALAGPLAYKLARRSGVGKAFAIGLLVTLLAVAPVAVYRTIYLGHDANTVFVEWSQAPAAENVPSPLDHLLVTMTSPSFEQLGEAMHLPLGDAGRLKIHYDAQPLPSANRDVIADTLADGWLLINAALAGLAAISAGVMLARRRFAETLLLGLPLLALAFTTLPPTEALRLPMIALVGVLATGLFATRSVPFIDEEAREAKRLAKEAKREEKERAKQDRELAKHKQSLYAFDKPTKPKQPLKENTESEPTQGILTQHEEEPTQLGARPI